MMHFKVCQATKKVIPDQSTAYCAAAAVLVACWVCAAAQCQKVTKME